MALKVTPTKGRKITRVGNAVAKKLQVTKNAGMQKTANPMKETTGFTSRKSRTVPTPSLKHFKKKK